MYVERINADQAEIGDQNYIRKKRKIMAMYNQGYNSLQIAAACSCTIEMVRSILRAYEYMRYKPYQRKVAADA